MKTVKEWLSEMDVNKMAEEYVSNILLRPGAVPNEKEKCGEWFKETVAKLLRTEAAPSSDVIFVAAPEYHELGICCVPRMYQMSELLAHNPGEPLNSYCWSLSPISEVLATPIAETSYMLRNRITVLTSIIEEAMEFSDSDEGKAEMVNYLHSVSQELSSTMVPGEELCAGIEEEGVPAPEAFMSKTWPELEKDAEEKFDTLRENIHIAFNEMNSFCRELEFGKVKQMFAPVNLG